MSRVYQTLTALELLHDFYASGACEDLVVMPSAETLRMLQKYRLIWGTKTRLTKSSYTLLQETVDGVPLFAVPERTQFRFALKLTNKSFFNFTDLATPNGGEVYVFANAGGSTELLGASPVKYPLRGGPFSWNGIGGGATMVRATHTFYAGESRTASTFTENGSLQARFDLQGLKPGLYGLYRDGVGTPDTHVYYDPEFAGEGVFAFLHLNKAAPLALGNSYTLSFTASSPRWKYFLVLKGDHSDYEYAIEDQRESATLTFDVHDSVAPAYVLTAADQATLDNLQNIYGDAEIKVFVSSQDIPYQDNTRSLITLGRTKPPSLSLATVIQHLPNPPIGNANAAVIVGVDPPSA